ncbi:hypothetical protein FB45DRAFT_951962 [Roridomyces roridus]|uniref:Uncharacterized protein n=1 Tax=Roridomyces roridus TaxID=1738132 RepID=A0AAD7AZM7_9AGAR|nr:hypothetical protein FB45DRAFT_951962 [Roridomyces roridus]
MNSTTSGISGRSQSFIRGRGLPALSRTLLHSGQAYYLITVGVNVFSLVFGLNLPPSLHTLFSSPNIALENAMACRVYRALRLGMIRSDFDFGTLDTSRLEFLSFVVRPLPESQNSERSGEELEMGTEEKEPVVHKEEVPAGEMV